MPSGWRLVLLALAAFVVLPLLPQLQLLLPIPQTIVLLTTILAVYGLIGWWKGGNGVIAIIWLVLAIWMLASPVLGSSSEAYSSLVRGWLLLLAAAFGIASLLTPEQPFFTRAMATLGIAIAVSFAMIVMLPNGMANVRGVTTTEYTRRAEHIIAGIEQGMQSTQLQEFVKQHPSFDSMAVESETQMRALPKYSSTVMPALLALESLAALALVWALYHRMAATPLGPMLGAWRDFRFNDQLIWGLAVATIFFLPQFVEGESAGWNLLLFFGALYLLRGVGVLSWVSRGHWGAISALIIVTFIAPPLMAAVALGVGVGDTWKDWRSRVPTAA